MVKRRKSPDGDEDDHYNHHHGNNHGKSSKSKKSHDGESVSGNHANNNNGGSNSSNPIPIFLKKTYRMIEACDPEICSWTDDGEMFVVKQPEQFASEIIPQYFDHNKFSSFARQLNFYGFRKIQTKPIRNEDFDKSTAKHVTFFNEKFKRGRYDLLKEIQRSTRGGGAQASLADQAREMETLRSTVATLEQRVGDLEGRWQDMAVKMEREIQAKVELAMMDLLSSRSGGHAHPSMAGAASASLAAQAGYMAMPNLPTSFGDAAILQRAERSFGSIGRNPHGTWENPLLGPQAARAFSTASASSGMGGGNAASQAGTDASSGGATLPPHPKQKNLPPPAMGGLPQSASGGMHNVTSGGLSLASAANPNLLRNAWEDKFFSTLMMTDNASRAASLAGFANGMTPGGMPGGANVSGLAALAAAQQMQQQQQQQAAQQKAGVGNYAAYMHERAQRGISAGGQAVAAGRSVSSGSKSSSLKRQTTAEILLEAAGELGNGGKDKEGGRGSKPDSHDVEV